MDSSLQSLEELPPQTFKYEEHSKQNHLNYLPRSQSSLELSSKASRNLTNHKSVKLYGFKSLKHRRISTTNLQRRRTHQEHVKNTKNMKNKEFLTSLQPEIHCNSISKIFDPFFSQIEGYFVFISKSHYYKSNQQVF